MTALAWVIAVVAVAVAAIAIVALRRSREVVEVAPAVEQPAIGPEVDALSAAFDALPMTAVLVGPASEVDRVNPAALRAFPFLRTGVGVLEAFGDHMLASRVRDALASGEDDDFEL